MNEMKSCIVLKAENTYESFSVLLYKALYRYINSLYTATNLKPVGAYKCPL